MNVADLQQFLNNLSVTLTSAGAKKPAEDLSRMAAGLEPFHTLGLAQFSDFLAVAESYQRTGVVPATGKSRAKKPTAPAPDSAAKVGDAVQRVQKLYEQAIDPDLQHATIDQEIKALDKLLKKEEAVQVAQAVGIALSLTTKKAALEAIKRRITERKESFERTQFREMTR